MCYKIVAQRCPNLCMSISSKSSKKSNKSQKLLRIRFLTKTKMEKTFGKIKTLKNRRKLSLPAANSSDERPSMLDFEARSIRRLRGRSPSPASTINVKKVPWNHHHRSSSPLTLSENEEDDDIFLCQNTEVKVKAMRKSLRSRSVCAPSPASSNSATYSLMAGLKGVNSIVSVTGGAIAGRRLSNPAPGVPYEAGRAKRSDSACTVEEDARRLKAYVANRHGSLPVVIVNDGNYAQSMYPIHSIMYCYGTRYFRVF